MIDNKIKIVSEFTNRKIEYLHHIVEKNQYRAVLANLRKGVGRTPGDIPQLWEFFLEGLPDQLQGNDGPSKEEWAIYNALTLFALHQQGKTRETQWMCKNNVGIGKAMAQLVHSDSDLKRIKRRFDIFVTSKSIEEFTYHLRSIIQMLRDKEIPLDYPKLATDLYLCQNRAFTSKIRLKWGQDFYRYLNSDNVEQKEVNGNE